MAIVRQEVDRVKYEVDMALTEVQKIERLECKVRRQQAFTADGTTSQRTIRQILIETRD
jgi:hypothetical protein